MRMLRLIALVLFVCFSADTLSQDADSLKCWSSTDKLKWSDFRGKIPDENSSLHVVHAVTWYRLNAFPVQSNGLLNYDIGLVFRRNKSWAADTSKSLLAHEQLHFDIAELYARKLREVIQVVLEANRNPTEQDFKTVIKRLYLENAAMQKEYDDDTIHGAFREAQMKWEEKIFLELKKLAKYASLPADCK